MTALAEGVAEIVDEVWSTVLGLPIARHEGTAAEAEVPAHLMMTCIVPIEGAWTGALAVTCPSALAERLAAAMLDVAHPEPADVRDALGEITNIVAGNTKPLLPQPSTISLPVVTVGRDYSVGVPSIPAVARLAFQCEGFVLTVTVLGSERAQNNR